MDPTYSPTGGKVSNKTEMKGMFYCAYAYVVLQETEIVVLGAFFLRVQRIMSLFKILLPFKKNC